MGKRRRRSPLASESPRASRNAPPEKQKKPALWKSLLTSLVAVIVFFGSLEAVLALFGVNPALRSEDPFFGFSSDVPLFVEETDSEGRVIMTTAKNKLSHFNMQRFPRKKGPGAYLVFCLGGSTTYGRPYNDKTSFAGWLRELLPAADDRRHWEIVNAGGISYASYRVTHLMRELVRYEPDLFIVYSGHNEFLEERTYGALRDIPVAVRVTASLLARTRTWAAMSTALNRFGVVPDRGQGDRAQLTGEVNTMLDRSAGPELYKRDDLLRDRILLHYRISLERMVEIARSVGTDVIFVTPASNLKDSSPFKSQHTDGLSVEEERRSERLLSTALMLIQEQGWLEALEVLDEALAIDPRHAELHYRRGRVLLALGRYDEAAEALRRGRDEDVCPLRALTPMREILAEVAEDNDVSLVDFVDLIGQRGLRELGHDIPGEEYFLDHVHPTLAGNRMLALQLIEVMADKGIVQLSDRWSEEAISEVSARVEGSLDPKEQARALVNLARVLNWAGKDEDAGRLARQVMTYQEVAPQEYLVATSILATLYQRQGDYDQALLYLRRALQAAPKSPRIHLRFGLTFLNEPLRNLEVATAHILLATVFLRESDLAYVKFGLAMAERQRYSLAYSSLMEAVRINPQNADAKSALDGLRELLEPDARNPALPKVSLEKYASGVPSKIVQVRPDATGRYLPDGIWTEWYESGELKRFVDYVNGVPHGVEITWSPDGEVVSRIEYRHGRRVEAAAVR